MIQFIIGCFVGAFLGAFFHALASMNTEDEEDGHREGTC